MPSHSAPSPPFHDIFQTINHPRPLLPAANTLNLCLLPLSPSLFHVTTFQILDLLPPPKPPTAVLIHGSNKPLDSILTDLSSSLHPEHIFLSFYLENLPLSLFTHLHLQPLPLSLHTRLHL